MKQILQNLKSGDTILADVPAPVVTPGQVLIKTSRSLVSLGTERMLVEFSKAGLLAKARQQPDKVKMVLGKIRADGLVPTLEAVFSKLEQPIPLGYCNVGRVIAVGTGVKDLKVGDRVASNGQHAEYVSVPRNLVAKVPDEVTDDEAAFTVVGAIGLQGIRLLQPTLGETVVVVGLGLIGLITAELLQANGCRVIGVDLDDAKLEIAQAKGILTFNPNRSGDVVRFVHRATNQVGADGVIITASAKTDEIIAQAAQMSRKRGRIVLVGVIGLNINRADFYEKELSFQVSCSYGPGRYDDVYEQHGHDYPLPYVRWTEQRNFEAVLYSIATGRLQVKPLISEIVDLEEYHRIYSDMSRKDAIALLLRYNEADTYSTQVQLGPSAFEKQAGIWGIIGAGNFTKRTIMPILKQTSVRVKYMASARGVNGSDLAAKYDIPFSTTDYQDILQDDEVDTVLITTRHHLHASMTLDALDAGKHVFVEKPLCLNNEELDAIIEAYQKRVDGDRPPMITVGFNRRFSPHVRKMKELLGTADVPKNIVATMNAGAVPPDVWVHDLQVGGGRIIGEACHFIDLVSYLAGSKVTVVCMSAMGVQPEEHTDNASILLKYENGTNGVIHYFANGHHAYSKERVEVYSQGNVLILDNFRVLNGYGFRGFNKLKTRLDKGHKYQFRLLAERVQSGGTSLIPFDSLVNTTRASFAAIESMKCGAWVEVSK